MPWNEDRQERTEQATPRRREQAREKGQVAKSKEIGTVAILLTGLGVFYFFGNEMFQSLRDLMKEFLLKSGSVALDQKGLYILFRDTLIEIAYLLTPLLFFPLIGIAANIVQVGFLVTTEPLIPNLSRINPVEGFKRLISPTALVEIFKGLLKLSVIGYMAYVAVSNEMDRFGLLTSLDVREVIFYFGSAAFRVLLMTSWILILVAIMDYAFQWWETEKSLRMTKQEVKEEMKETEGQPQVKARIRSLQRDLARRRMMQEVPKATVVITNPNHLAIAIRYEQGEMRAPVVLAKGMGLVAEKIKEVARNNGIPLIENKPLAQTLWKTVDIGHEIPTSLYNAVAEILAYVYRLRAQNN